MTTVSVEWEGETSVSHAGLETALSSGAGIVIVGGPDDVEGFAELQ